MVSPLFSICFIMKSLTLSPILSDTKLILKAYKRPLLLISVLMGMLIFVMNVFLATAQYGTSFNLQMKDKLGIYVYLKENVTPENQPDIALKSALEAQGLRVEYTSKQDALKFVEKRIPDLVATFKKYHLDNPLPTTLYVKYSNQEEFQRMKKVLSHYKEMILNGNELSDTTIKTQEKRILNIINLSTFLQSFAYFVVGTMILTIIAFAIFFLKSTFSHFYADIQAKKLL